MSWADRESLSPLIFVFTTESGVSSFNEAKNVQKNSQKAVSVSNENSPCKIQSDKTEPVAIFTSTMHNMQYRGRNFVTTVFLLIAA